MQKKVSSLKELESITGLTPVEVLALFSENVILNHQIRILDKRYQKRRDELRGNLHELELQETSYEIRKARLRVEAKELFIKEYELDMEIHFIEEKNKDINKQVKDNSGQEPE